VFGQMNLDDNNTVVMKLLHYFITEKDYNPIILQGADNEIWLENMNEDYKVVRIVTEKIYNDEQFTFDSFKTKRIVKKIKRKTLTFNIPVLSIFLNLGDNVSKEELNNKPNQICINLKGEDGLKNNSEIVKLFPDIIKKTKFAESGVELFAKITTDINKHNENDAREAEKVFKSKTPYITYIIILLNVIAYIYTYMIGDTNSIIGAFAINGPAIRSGEYYRLITGMFLHGGIFHILFNMYALYVIGSQLESFLGKIKYIIIYLLSGISGGLLSMILSGSSVFSIGASGAIFGLMGSLLYFGLQYRVYLGNFVRTQLVPLLVFNLILGAVSPGIDNFGHIGGLIGGILTTKALGINGKTSKFNDINGIIITCLYFIGIVYLAFFYIK